MQLYSPETDYYFQRFGFCPVQIQAPPPSDLGLVVAIPCYNEPGLIETLDALARCEPPRCGVEIIVVVNAAEGSAPEVLLQNERSARELRAWANDQRRLAVHLIECNQLPRRSAGAGLARKIGMDEALRRLDAVRRAEGVIVCLDADCVCDANYLAEIERFFRGHPRAPGGSLYFEHPLEGEEPAAVYNAITAYELHLRYYVEGLRYAGFPHAFHTIGSSMAVRAEAYRAQGGMNKRQAGEDFYFLHKIIPLGAFGEINSTRVLASPRPSDRVPFGTGRAVRSFLETGSYPSYPRQAFADLRELFSQAPKLFSGSVPPLPEPLRAFLDAQSFSRRLEEIRKHSSTPAAFQKRFFRWFDGFLAMKYIHFARDTAYGCGEIARVASDLLEDAGSASSAAGARELLLRYRELQRRRGAGAPPKPGAAL